MNMATKSTRKSLLIFGLIILVLINAAASKRLSRHQKTRDEAKASLPNNVFRDTENKEATVDTSSKSNVCEGWWCGHGKECQSGKNGMPECICLKRCPNLGVAKKKVCGSDGKLYSSHCELHRAACTTNTLLYIDHSGICFDDRDRDSDEDVDDDDDDDDDNDRQGNTSDEDRDDDETDNSNAYQTINDNDNNNNKKNNKSPYEFYKEKDIKKKTKQSIKKKFNLDKDSKKLNTNDAPTVKGGGGNDGGLELVESWPKLDALSAELDYKSRAKSGVGKTSIPSSQDSTPSFVPEKNGWGPLPKAKLSASSSTDFLDSLESDLDDDDDDDVDDDDDDDEDEENDGDDDFDTNPAKKVKNKNGPSLPKEMLEQGDLKRKQSKGKSELKSQTTKKKQRSEKEIRRDSSSSLCSPQEYEILKDNLMLYCHEKMIGGAQNFKKAMESGNNEKLKKGPRSGSPTHKHPESLYNYNEALGDGPEAGKDYLLSLMFSHFDQNNNGALEYEELEKAGNEQNLGKLAPGCNLVDLLRFDDEDRNSQLSINEFYTAFNKLYSVSVISLDKAVEVTHVTVNVGDNVELKCDVTGYPPMPIVWKRYGVDLSTLNQEDQVRVFSDGTLFLSKIQLLYSGNYTCQAQKNDKVVQTHMLTVQTLPDVKVTPHIVWEKPGHEVTLECRVMGEPIPVVRWLKNDDPLETESDKYVITGDSIRLTLKDIYFASTGAYICEAENSAGKRLDIASLVVIDDETPSTGQTNESQFFVFHELGLSVYNPDNCRIQHQISSTDIIPGTQEYVCGEHGQVCEWGSAIPISSTYVYVSQPKLDRILVISIAQMVVVDVISTDRYPVELNYIPHLDQCWVRCWRKDEIGSQKTLQVIRDAKEKKKHHTVHPEPIDSHFDLVENIFLPPDMKSSSQFRYAYVSHKNARGLYKMDLVGIRYTKSIDLTPYNCFPQHVEFSALYGMIIVECFEPVTKRPTGQLILDALTDAIVYFKGDRFGRPYLSPDSRKLITITHSSDGSTLMLQFVKENGLEFVFDVKTSLNVSDISFFPSQRLHTYDLYASCADKDEVLFLNLESGKVEMVSGVGGALRANNIWRSAQRPISSQGLFSNYLVTPSSDAVFILNGRSHTVNCQIGGIPKPNLIVWL